MWMAVELSILQDKKEDMNYTLITGATSDIGIQICKTLEESGHCLLLTDLKQEALVEVRNILSAAAVPRRAIANCIPIARASS